MLFGTKKKKNPGYTVELKQDPVFSTSLVCSQSRAHTRNTKRARVLNIVNLVILVVNHAENEQQPANPPQC